MAPETLHDISLLRMSIHAVRERLNQDLNALEAKIDQLLPPELPPERPIDYKKWRDERMSEWKHRR